MTGIEIATTATTIAPVPVPVRTRRQHRRTHAGTPAGTGLSAPPSYRLTAVREPSAQAGARRRFPTPTGETFTSRATFDR